MPERVEALLLVCPLAPTAGREEQLLPGHSPSSLRLYDGIRSHPCEPALGTPCGDGCVCPTACALTTHPL